MPAEGEDSFHRAAKEQLRDYFVMSRTSWITYLRALFDQLESFNQNKQTFVENENFVSALKRVKLMLPLEPKGQYFQKSSEMALSYRDVDLGL